MGEVWYRKENGKFVPINDPWAYDGLAEGSWLVTVKPGSKSIRRAINPKFIELEAALEYLEEGLVCAISEACKARPSSVRMSNEEIKAWEQFEKIAGDDFPKLLHYASNSDIARAGCDYVKKIMTEYGLNIKKIKKAFKKIKVSDKNNSMAYLKIQKV